MGEDRYVFVLIQQGGGIAQGFPFFIFELQFTDGIALLGIVVAFVCFMVADRGQEVEFGGFAHGAQVFFDAGSGHGFLHGCRTFFG